jgi:prepilin peptidase CpaA
MLIYIFIFVELLAVAYFDLKQKKIYNVWAIINLLAFGLTLYSYPHFYFFKMETFIFSLVFLGVGIVLYALKIMGPGDTKFLFSFFLLIPITMQDDFFFCLAFVTIVVGLSMLMTNLIENRSKLFHFFKTGDFFPLKQTFGKKFPFAPLIFISWMWFGWRNMVSLV